MVDFYYFMLLDGWSRLMIDALCLSTLIGLLGLLVTACCVRQPAARAWVLLITMTACAVLPITNCLVRTAGLGVPVRISKTESVSGSVDWQRDDSVAGIAENKTLPKPDVSQVASKTDWQPGGEELAAESVPLAATAPSAGREQLVLNGLGFLWLGLSTIFLLRLLASVVSVQRITRSAQPCTDDQVLAAIARKSRQLGLPSPPRTLVSDKIPTPMVLAFFNKTVFIPNDERMSVSKSHLETVLAHELAHIKRHDGWKRLWVHLIVVLLPLQPLVWLMKRSYFAAAEEACDDMAVAGGNDPVDLATVLTTWSSASTDQSELLLAAGMSATRTRVLRLLNKSYTPLPQLSSCWQCWVSVVALLSCSGLSLTHFSNEPAQEPAPNEPVAVVENTETIAGTCLDENGQPIPNVKLRLFCMTASNLKLQQTELESTTSDAQGKFSFQVEALSGEAAGWALVAQCQGKATVTSSIHENAPDKSTMTFQLPPAQTLRGKVLDSGGNPVEGAVVSFLNPLAYPVDGIQTSISDANGHYEVTDLPSLGSAQQERQDEGWLIATFTFPVEVRHPDFAWAYDFVVSKVPGTVDITLQAPATVEGRITLEENGKPAACATVEFFNHWDGPRQWSQTVANDNGHYTVEHLVPGKYRVAVRFDNRPNLFLHDVELVAGNNSKDISLERGGILKGQVVNVFSDEPFRLADGEKMDISEHDGDGRGYFGMPATSVEPDGSFELLMPAGRRYFGMYIGNNWRGVNLDKLGEQGVEIVTGETTEVEIRLRPRKQPAKSPVGPQMDVPTQAAVAAIKQLGGWVELETIDGQQHVVEVNMVYHEDEEFGRDDNDLIHDECLAYVSKFPYLKRLLLKEQQATDAGLANIQELNKLEAILIWDGAAVSDVGVAHLGKMTSLSQIHISNSKITDESLRIFSKLPKLEAMSLQGNQFTNKGLEYIQDMIRLKSLWLGQGSNEITDDGLPYLLKLTQLESLDLQGSKITDSGLKHLHSLKQLKEFYHADSNVTDKGYADLKKVLPKLDR